MLFHFSKEQRSSCETNLQLCFPQQDEATRTHLAKSSLIEMGKTITEIGPLWFWEKERVLNMVMQVSGQAHLRNAIAQGKGVLLAAPHLGSWEMMGPYFSALYPMTIMYRPPRMQAIDATMRQARERFGAKLAPTTLQGVRTLYKALGKGELVAILPDQDPRDGGGLFAPFFGVQAYTMTLLARLAKKSGAPILFCYAERLPRGKGFHLHLMLAEWDATQCDIQQNIEQINAGVEQCIMQCPQQYQWSYKRFRTRPDGEKPLYD